MHQMGTRRPHSKFPQNCNEVTTPSPAAMQFPIFPGAGMQGPRR